MTRPGEGEPSRSGGPSHPGHSSPPRLPARLLDLLERTEDRGSVRGDLDEEFARHVLPERGLGAARRWYWRQALASVPRLVPRWFQTRVPRTPGPGGARGGRGADPREGWVARRRADLRYAARALGRRPGTTAAAAATFALALGANASVFSVVWGVLLRPLPYANAERMVRIHPDELFYTQLAGAQRFAGHATAFDAVVPWGRSLFTFTGGDDAEEVRGGLVAWNHFDVLGAPPALGRGFRREDAEVWPADVVVISHALWVRRFGADPGVVGSRVEVGGRPRTVVGVMGPDHVPVEPDWEAWGPLPLDAALAEGRGLAMNARLAPGVSLADGQANARRALAESWAEDGYTATEEELAAVRVIPLRDHLLGDARRPLWILMGAVVGILLLACANVANLLLAQGEGRAAEIAVRLSLGATRARVAAQLLLETALTAAAGCGVGLWLAWVGVRWMSSRLPAGLPRAGGVDVGGAGFLFAVGALVVAVLLTALYPALRAASGSLREDLLQSGSRTGNRGRGAPLLVGVEVALAVLLVVSAGLLLRTLGALSAVDPGFDPAGVAAVRVSPPPGRYDADGALDALYRRLRTEVAALPGVTSVGGIMFLPMTSGGAWSRYRADPAPPAGDEDVPSSSFRIVMPGYFETLRIPLMRGRAFNEGDGADAPRVAVVNETFARTMFPGGDVLGRQIYQGDDEPTAYTVVGVVADVRQTSLRDQAFPEIYLPLGQNPFTRMYVLARTAGDPAGVLGAMQGAMRAVDDGLILTRSATVEDIVGATVADTRLLAQLLTLFGLVALSLGAVGVYGVTAHAVSRRRREIGIRLALGADGRAVATRIVRRGMIPVAVGLAAGTAAALLLGRVLAGVLFGVETADPVTFVAVPTLLTLVALGALALPAGRAARLDPVLTLREE